MPNKDTTIGMPFTIRAVGLGALFALLGSLLLLLPLSALVSSELLPAHNMAQICLFLVALCALLGARFAVRRGEGAPLLLAALTGLLFCLLLLAVSFVAFGQPSLQADSLWILAVAFLGAVLASFFGKGKPSKRNKKR